MSDEQKKQDEHPPAGGVAAAPREAEIAELKKQNEKYLNDWKRALADYDNLKRDTAKEKNAMGEYARAMAAMEFVAVYEHLKTALGHEVSANNFQSWKEGVTHVKNQMAAVLKILGLEEIKTVGEKLDLQKHESVGEEAVEGQSAGIVLKEVEGGYQVNGKVIKAAKVIVSK